MNRAVVFYLLGVMFVPVSCSLALSALVGWGHGERIGDASVTALIGTSILGFVLVTIFLRLGKTRGERIFRREALAAVGLGWIGASLLGALPFWLGVPGMLWADALFESTSAITTTGATVLSGLQELPASILFWRSIAQWLGGLGVVVFFAAVLSSLGVGAKILFSNENTGAVSDFEQGRVQKTAIQLMLLYLGLSSVCCIAYQAAGMSVFDAFCHTFTTVSTAGFSTYDDSIAHFGSAAIEWIAIIFMVLGGTTFVFMLRLCRGRGISMDRNNEVFWYLVMLVVASFFVALYNYPTGDWGGIHETVRGAVFQVVSIATTTGYGTQDYTMYAGPAQVFMIAITVACACSGSTSGGPKMIRTIIALKVLNRSLVSAFRPSLLRPIRVNQKVLDEPNLQTVLVYLMLLFAIAVGSMLLVAIFEPELDLISIFGAVQATLLNIGPGWGAVGPSGNFSFLSGSTKHLLAFLMVLGRLELFAVMVLLIPSFWRRYR